MRAAAVVNADAGPDLGKGLVDIGVGPQVDLRVFDGSPQALHEDALAPGALAVHADLDLAGGQHLHEICGCELTALIADEELGLDVSKNEERRL